MNQGMEISDVDDGTEIKSETKMENKIQLAARRSPRPSLPTWAWILGSVLTITSPFWVKKLRKLLKLEDVVEKAVENVGEAVKNDAEMAEKVLEGVEDNLPVNGQLKDAITLVECGLKGVETDAEATIGFIHKIDEFIKQEEETFDQLPNDQGQPVDKEGKYTK